jgi:GntR family negative regulator for fad regulon and positive regulator of fabA
MNRPTAPQRPAEYAEEYLVSAITDGTYPPGSALPGERDLAAHIGITRPTLREALQRLERDGWVTIQQGKSTTVNDIWKEGGLNVLSTLVRYDQALPQGFVTALLEVRCLIAPAYAHDAAQHDAPSVTAHLQTYEELDDLPAAYAEFDWTLHHVLSVASGNPIYPLILNGFGAFYRKVASHYFALPEARQASRAFYVTLLAAIRGGDAGEAERVTQEVMAASLDLWRKADVSQSGDKESNK